MEIKKIEKNEPKYPTLKKTVAVAAAAVALTAALGGCRPHVVGGLEAYVPDDDETVTLSGDVAYIPDEDNIELASGDVALLHVSGADLDIELISRSDASYSDVVIVEGTGSGNTQD